MEGVRNKDVWAKPLLGLLTMAVAGFFASIPSKSGISVPPGSSPLEKALADGSVTYRAGIFRGKLTAAIAKDLKAMGATYNSTFGGWSMRIIDVPNKISALARKADDNRNSWVARIQAAVKEYIPEPIALVALPLIYQYLVGKVGSEIARTTGEQPDLEMPRSGLDAFSDATLESVNKLNVANKDDIIALMDKAAAEDWSILDVERELTARYSLSKERVKFMAKQGMAIASTNLKAKMYVEIGLPYYRWITKRDGRVRPDHAALDGEIFSWTDPPIVNVATGKRAHPQQDWNCFLPDTLIDFGADKLIRSYQRFYDGKIVRLHFGSGEWISVTPNHPIFTARGWVAAKEIKVDDKLLKRVPMEVLYVMAAEPNDRGVKAQEIHSLLSASFSSERVRDSEHYFHGDGSPSHDIDVVTCYRPLGYNGDSGPLKVINDQIFSDPDMRPSFLTGSRDFSPMLVGLDLPTDSVVRRSHLVASTNGTHARPFDFFSFTRCSSFDSSLDQDSLDNEPADAEVLRNSLFADSRFIEILNVSGDQVYSVPHSGSLFSHTNVSKVELVSYTGNVYNFQTDSNTYMANGILSSNCRCDFAPLQQNKE